MAANAGTRLHGKNGAIYLYGAKGQSGAIKIAVKTEWTLNLNRDYADATAFGDTNKQWLAGVRDVQGTWTGLLDVSGDALVTATQSDSIPMYLYGDDRAGFELLLAFGPALIDGQIQDSVNDAIKTSGNYRAAGNWAIFNAGSL